MDSTPGLAIPVWVRKRDGRTEPFEAEKINRALFAATESLGQPDAFLARELTDSVLHFLAAEAEQNHINSAQIEDTLQKVVRELGQPQIARAVAEFSRQRNRSLARRHPPPAVGLTEHFGPAGRHIRTWINLGATAESLLRLSGAASLEQFSLEHVFAKNLVAAHREGLLVLGGLAGPCELCAAVVRPAPVSVRSSFWRLSGVFEAVEQARQYVSGTLALDAPERELAQRGARIGEAAAFVRELELAARTLGLHIVLNLGSETAPSWAEESSTGPLFAELAKPEGSEERVLGHLDALTEQVLLHPAGDALRLDWHLTGRDFAHEESRQRLLRLTRAALEGAPLAFVCDRPRRPVVLAEGLDRQYPAVLQWVGLDLLTLRRREKITEPDQFLGKLMSLARLAAGAGVQKRDFIRRHGRPNRPTFMLDRARLGLWLRGLPEIVHGFFDGDRGTGDVAGAFVQGMARRLHETLEQEAQHIHLYSLCDATPMEAAEKSVTGNTATDWKTELRGAGRLHAAFGRGTVWLPFSAEAKPLEPVELLELLYFAWRQTSVSRIRITRDVERQTQLTVPWEDA